MQIEREDYERIIDTIENKRQQIIDLTQQLIRIPTETHPPTGDEKKAQEFLAKKFRNMGLQVDVFRPDEVADIAQHPGWWPGINYKDRPNVVGLLRGLGSGQNLILNGHIDVVPPGDSKKWNHDPFSAELAGGKIFGRGAADMKGGIAAMIVAVESILESGYLLRGDVTLESVVNEELGGFNGTLSCCLKGYGADAAIIAEPSKLRICPATKGCQVYKLRIPGKSVHISLWWQGVSAIENAIKVKKVLESFEKIRTEENRQHPFYGDAREFPTPAIADAVYFFAGGDPEIMAPPNEVIMYCMIDVLPGEDHKSVLRRFERYLIEKSSIDLFLKDNPPQIEKVVMRPMYPTEIASNHPIVLSLDRAYRQVVGESPTVCGFESACDAMIFNKYSTTPCVIFGPGDLGMCHGVDENVSVDELIKATQIFAITMMEYCSYKKA